MPRRRARPPLLPLLLALLLSPALAIAGEAQASQLAQDARDAVVRRQEAILIAAIANKDRDALERLIDDGFVLRQDPPLNRAEWVEEILRLCGGGRTDVQDLTVGGAGEVGIVSLNATLYRDPACDPPSLETLTTDVWELRDNEWRLTLRHVSASAGSRPAPATAVKPASTPEWAGSGELSLLLTTGNVETQSTGLAGELTWQRGPWRSIGKASFVRTTNFGQEQARSINSEFRQSRAVSPYLDVFARALYQRDLFAGMLHRYGGDAGVGVRAAHAGQTVELSLGAGSTREVRLAGTDSSFPVGRVGVRYRWVVLPSLTFSADSNYTNSLTVLRNWRIESTLSASATLIRPFSVKLSYATKYLRQPVAGFERTDAVISSALVARF